MNLKISDDLLLNLKKDIFHRAEIFIDNIGEFAPFGSELINSEIKPVVIYDDTEKIIDGKKLINILKNELSHKIKNNTIHACAIAYDVIINRETTNGVIVKSNALCLIYSIDGFNWEEDYYTYKIINQKCVWG